MRMMIANWQNQWFLLLLLSMMGDDGCERPASRSFDDCHAVKGSTSIFSNLLIIFLIRFSCAFLIAFLTLVQARQTTLLLQGWLALDGIFVHSFAFFAEIRVIKLIASWANHSFLFTCSAGNAEDEDCRIDVMIS